MTAIQKRYPVGTEVKIMNVPHKSKFLATPDPMRSFIGKRFKVLGYSVSDHARPTLKLNTSTATEEFKKAGIEPEDFYFLSSWVEPSLYTTQEEIARDYPVGAQIEIGVAEAGFSLGVNEFMKDSVGKVVEVLGYDYTMYDGVACYHLVTSLATPEGYCYKFYPHWVELVEPEEAKDEEPESGWGTAVGGAAAALFGAALLGKAFKKKEEVKKEKHEAEA